MIMDLKKRKKRDLLILANVIIVVIYLIACSHFTYQEATIAIWVTAVIGLVHVYLIKLTYETLD